MEQKNVTVGSISREMLKNFTHKHRSNGRQCWDLREDIAWQHRIILEANNHRHLSSEVYSSIFKVLMEIYIADNSDQAMEFLHGVEPYDTVSQLTGWLDASPENLKFVNRSLVERQTANGMDLLSHAHKLYLEEIGCNLVNAIEHHIRQVYQVESTYAE